MKKKYYYPAFSLLALLSCPSTLWAQLQSASATYKSNQITDRSLFFDTTAAGDSLPIKWGLDTAWASEENMRRGISYIGQSNLSLARVSFQPWAEIVNGVLPDSLRENLDYRLGLVSLMGDGIDIVLNDDPGDGSIVDAAYSGNPTAWANLISTTAKIVQDEGWNVISVSPFNEPDYGWGQGTVTDFYNIAKLLKEEYAGFDTIRICGGNTLNCDQALTWYNSLKDYLDEGNTHQLAGDFDHYADFFTQVRADGKYTMADELHNVMEAMVGVEYGMQSGIWWGTAELARGEFCQASNNGTRLAYAENRDAWTAASVYRNGDGEIQAFGGTSERQAVASDYRFVSLDRDVFFDGYGPQREYVMELPGGAAGSYQNGQTNAERVVNITWGEDVQPPINGTYVIMNALNRRVLTTENGASTSGTYICLNSYANNNWQEWNVVPVESTIGDDFSYYSITSSRDDKSLDVLNYSLENYASIILYDKALGGNQQWYFEYDGDGYFHIVNRFSNLCLEISGSNAGEGGRIRQAKKASATRQKWRLLQVGVTCETRAPEAPTDLKATALPASIQLDWTASTSDDVANYTVLRADSTNGEFNTVGRFITGTSFVDNTVAQNKEYVYKIKAVDYALNSSETTDVITAKTSGEKTMIAQYQFEDTLMDNTDNMFDASSYDDMVYVTGTSGSKAVRLLGDGEYIQIPYQLGNQSEMTIATWINCRSSDSWQRVFDFGNGESDYMFFTTNDGSSSMRFVMRKDGGTEQILDCGTRIRSLTWAHLAITISEDSVICYVNGEKVASTADITIRPSDIKPVLNYIGRSQYDADPTFTGYIDDFRIYNYALSASEISDVMNDLANGTDDIIADSENSPVINTEYVTVGGLKIAEPQSGVNIERSIHKNGAVTTRKVMK